MKEITLYCKVGRAAAQPLASSENSAVLDAVQANKASELLREGVDPARVVFERRNNVKGK